MTLTLLLIGIDALQIYLWSESENSTAFVTSDPETESRQSVNHRAKIWTGKNIFQILI